MHDVTPPVSYKDIPMSREQSCRPQTTARWHNSVKRVLTHMRSHIEEKKLSAEMASIGAMSRFHFTRVFRQMTGIPPINFLSAARLEFAKRLLLTTKLSITDICFEVGYDSLGTFVSRFTSLVGMPPGALRRVAQILEGTDLRPLCHQIERHEAGPSLGGIAGRITIEQKLSGVFFVGVYRTLLPHARPLHCACLTEPGAFRFAPCPGRYTVAAAGLDAIVTPISFLDEGIIARGASRGVTVAAGLGGDGLELVLGPATPFDPPILAPLPALLVSHVWPTQPKPSAGRHGGARASLAVGDFT